VRNGRALVAPDISNARLKQAFGNGQNALPAENFTVTFSQGLYFFVKRDFQK
jgi:hypothetical protein